MVAAGKERRKEAVTVCLKLNTLSSSSGFLTDMADRVSIII